MTGLAIGVLAFWGLIFLGGMVMVSADELGFWRGVGLVVGVIAFVLTFVVSLTWAVWLLSTGGR